MAAQLTTIRRRLTPRQRESMSGYLFISPWFVGFLIFTAGPLIVSLALSFTQWGFVDQPKWVGLQNYVKMVHDPIFWLSLRVTATFTSLSVPIVIVVALATALLMTRKLPGMYIYRVIYY